MLKIGITGGIGSGKSTICNVFEQLNIPVYYADIEAKKLLTDTEVKSKIISLTGTEILNPYNEIDKKLFAKMLFNSSNLVKQVNSIIHPLVAKNFIQWAELHSNQTAIIEEAALLFESNSYKTLDKTILVVSPLEVRIDRVMRRDNITRNEVLARIQNQMSDDEKIKLADFIIYNDDKQMILPQISDICRQLKITI
jgi:dephospho-CoA kinase